MKPAILLLHGFGGTPDELTHLRDRITTEGFTVRDPLLPGHGEGRAGLHRSRATVWLDGAREALTTLAEESDRIWVIGFSMGGLLAAHLAEHDAVERLVLINTPVYYWNARVILADVGHALRRRKWERMRYYRRAVGRVSARACVDFLRLLQRGKRQFAVVECPTLILQCRRDEVVRPCSAAYIHVRIPGSQLRYFVGGRHQFAEEANEQRDAMCDAVMEFLLTGEERCALR